MDHVHHGAQNGFAGAEQVGQRLLQEGELDRSQQRYDSLLSGGKRGAIVRCSLIILEGKSPKVVMESADWSVQGLPDRAETLQLNIYMH